ncbi:hypothetical protein [Tenacibaculum maritimum]|nr:hypothetical protein [Tenacibaculum maritimum]
MRKSLDCKLPAVQLVKMDDSYIAGLSDGFATYLHREIKGNIV